MPINTYFIHSFIYFIQTQGPQKQNSLGLGLQKQKTVDKNACTLKSP